MKKLVVTLLTIGTILILPAIAGFIIYLIGVGPINCGTNLPFLTTCIQGSYALLSFACGGIMWVIAIFIYLFKYQKRS